MTIAKIYNGPGKKHRVEFYQLEMIKMLKDRYDIKYERFEGTKSFVITDNNKIRKIPFGQIRKLFAEIVSAEFNNLKLDGTIDYDDFIKEYHEQKPIKLYCAREEFRIENYT